jgi:hypothetical protein
MTATESVDRDFDSAAKPARSAGRGFTDRQAPMLFALCLLLFCIALILFGLIVVDRGALQSWAWRSVGFQASMLATCGLAIIAQSRAFPIPWIGILFGLTALIGMPQLVTMLLKMVDIVLDVLVLVLDKFKFDGDLAREVIDQVFGQANGLSFFLGNLLLVILYTTFRGALASILWIVAKIPGFSYLRYALSIVPDDVWTNRWLAWFTGTVAVGAGAVVCGLSLLASMGARAALSTSNFPPGFERLVWAGTFIFLVELAAAFRPIRPVMRRGEDVRKAPANPDNSRIEAYYNALKGAKFDGFIDRGPEQVAFPEVQPPATSEHLANILEKVASQPARLVLQRVHEVSQHFNAGRITPEMIARVADPLAGFYLADVTKSHALVFNETVTTAHYTLFGEMALSAIDEGGIVLVLCPDSHVVDVELRFEEFLDRTRTNLIAQTLVVGYPPVPDQLYDIIIASETQFETLTGGQTRFRGMERLSLVIGIDMHLLDLPRVKLELQRLWTQVAIDRVRFAFTLTDYKDPKVLVAQLLGRTATEVRIGAAVPESQYRVAIPDTPTNRRAFLEIVGAKPQGDQVRVGFEDMLALAVLGSIKHGVNPVLHDPRGRRVVRGTLEDPSEPPWSQATLDIIEKEHAKDFQQFRSLRGFQHLFDGDPSPFGRAIVVEEMYNTDAALMRRYDFLDGCPVLVIIIVRDAPLRDVFGGDESEIAPILPMPPRPSASACEVAYVVQSALAGGLSQTALEAILEPMPKLLRTGRGYAANEAGLKRLLADALNNDRIELEPTEHNPLSGEPIYRVDGRLPRVRLTRRVALIALGQARDAMPETRNIAGSDIGLAYVRHGYTRLANRFEQIEEIDYTAIKTRPAGEDETNFARRRVARACPRYVLDFRAPFVVEEIPLFWSEMKARKAETKLIANAVIALGLVERTVPTWYDEVENEPPFMSNGTPAKMNSSADAGIPVPRTMRIMHLTWALSAPLGVQVGHTDLKDLDGAQDLYRADPNAVGAAAFAAVVLLKEAIAACFPGQGRRITVFSPQAKERLSNASDEASRYLLQRYGLESSIIGLPSWYQPEAPHLEELRQKLAKPMTSRIDLYVIEDADWSLGIVNAISGRVAEPYRFMLAALGAAPTFGADQAHPALGVNELRAYLEAWRDQRP